MSNCTHVLDSLTRLSLAQSERDAVAAILDGLVNLVSGHYSIALHAVIGSFAVDSKLQNGPWLGVDHEFSRDLSRLGNAHPFAAEIRRRPSSGTLLRSRLMDDIAWRRTEIYQQVDAPLQIADMVGIYFKTPGGNFCGAFCGRANNLTTPDLTQVDRFRKIANFIIENSKILYSKSNKTANSSKGLSVRESEVADWMAAGKSNHEVAIILGISRHTVRKHLENIFSKLNVTNRTSAAIEWLRHQR
jgi:DNA-binding CsgD family transcriptional regulator